jgi:1-acyl-sn-glycerol-3-phosphate acyltransferase
MRDPDFSTWWAFASALTRPIMRLLFRVHVEGAEHVPVQGPAILVFNHMSVLDGPSLVIETARRRRRKVRFLVAAEIMNTGLIGVILRSFDQIPIRRGARDVHAMDEALETLQRGAVVALAPEGKLNEEHERGLLRMKSGIARMALPSHAPIIPVGIWGTHILWPKDGARWGRILWRPRLALIYGEPIVPHGDLAVRGDVAEVKRRVKEALEVQLARAQAVAEATR